MVSRTFFILVVFVFLLACDKFIYIHLKDLKSNSSFVVLSCRAEFGSCKDVYPFTSSRHIASMAESEADKPKSGVPRKLSGRRKIILLFFFVNF